MPPIYATADELRQIVSKELLIEMTDDAGTGQVDDGVVSLALVNAEGEVNAALANAGYEVPVALPIPPGAEVIKTITLWLAT